MSRGQKLCKIFRIPLVTLCCVTLCCTLFLVKFHRQIGSKHKHLCLSSHGIVRSGEVYRIFTHAFFHKGPWHLAITMVPMLILGTITERQIGSILFLLVLILCWVMSAILEVAMATMLYHIFHKLFHGCSLGFSGIVFGLIVIMTKAIGIQECKKKDFKIPCSVIPWLCVFVYYFGFHRGSIFFHIGGIIAGYAYKYDAFNCCLPSPERLAELEHSDWLQFVVQIPCFIAFSKPELPHTQVTVRKGHFLIKVNTENSSGESGLTDV